MDEDRHQMLIRGLLHNENLFRLYQTNAYFNAAIKTLADMLRPMVNGLAAEAGRVDVRQRELMQAVMYDGVSGEALNRLLQDLD